MNITIEAKEVNVNITDDNGAQAFGYSTSNYSMSLNVSVLIAMGAKLFKQVMKIDREINSETQVSKVRQLPKIGETVYVVHKTGIGSVMWNGDGEHLEMWKYALCTTSFEEASEMLKREQEKE